LFFPLNDNEITHWTTPGTDTSSPLYSSGIRHFARRRNTMCKNQLLTRFRSSLAIAAVAVGLLAAASLPAAASIGVATQPNWAGPEHVQIYRHFNYAPVQPGLTYVPSESSGSCEPLPGASCQGYDVN
jgi:hypothetical protein